MKHPLREQENNCGKLCFSAALRYSFIMFFILQSPFAFAQINNNTISTSSTTVCAGTSLAPIQGSLPTGDTGSYTYSWEHSTTNGTSGFTTIAGAVSQNYTPGILNKTSWFRRNVKSGSNTSTSNVLQITVNTPVQLIASSPSMNICQGEITPLFASYNPKATASGSVTISSAATLNLAIPDDSDGVSNLLKVTGIPDGAIISEVSVKFNINHTRSSDLVINLKGPNGKVLNLADKIGSANNFTSTTFSSTSTNHIASASQPYNGVYKPEAAMIEGALVVPLNTANVSTFDALYGSLGSSANGYWIFSARDYVAGITGTMVSWSITIKYTFISNPANAIWTPITDLYANPECTIPYTENTELAIVYAKPFTNRTYVATFFNGCSTNANVNITVKPSPVLTMKANYCEFPDKVRLTAISNIKVNAADWKWSGGMIGTNFNDSSFIEPNTAGNFSVTAESSTNGCQVTGTLAIAQELVVNGDFSQGNTGFTSQYTYVPTPYSGTSGGLYPEKTYNIYHQAQYSHASFWGRDHTTGSGYGPDNFMIVNGFGNTAVIWEQTVTVLPNTNYYFSAYAMNLNNAGNYARLQFEVNDVKVGTVADLNNAPKPSSNSDVSLKNWIRFYSQPYWNSGSATTAKIRIINLEPATGGNDFGLDDISFGTLAPFLNLTSGAASANQIAACENTPISDITFEIGSDGKPPVIQHLPAGLTTSWDGRTLRISGTPAAGNADFSVSSTGCKAKTINGKINVSSKPSSGTLPALTSVCYGGSTTLPLTGSVGTIQWQSSPDKINWINASATANNITASRYFRVVAKNGSCPADTSLISKIGVRNLWAGENDSDWNNVKNWSNESLPTTVFCDTVYIPSGTNGPIIHSAPASVKNLKIYSNASVILDGSTLKVAGTIINNGTFDARNGTLELNGTVSQSISGSLFLKRTVNNLTISNPAGVQLTSTKNDTLNITGLVSFGTSNAEFKTNDNLTLKSFYSGTAAIADLTNNGANSGNSITGNVTVERFINIGTAPGQHAKSWQFLAPNTSGQTVKQSWMENGDMAIRGYGIQIPGPASTVAGFDGYSVSPSMKYYNPTTNSWVGITSAENLIDDKKAYMVFIRGDRSVNGSSITEPRPTTVRTKGKLFSGITTPTTVLMNAYEAIGNPYASPIDFTKISRGNGVDNKFYVWDPGLNGFYGYGGYQTISSVNNWKPLPGGTLAYPSGVSNSTIQSGQAFFVHATPVVGILPANYTVSFKETSKASTVSNTSFARQAEERTGNKRQFFGASLYAGSNPGDEITDGNLVAFDDVFSDDLDGDDALKLSNSGENFGIKRSSKFLVIDARKPVQAGDTIFYQLENLKAKTYQLRFAPENMDGLELEALLLDKYAKSAIPISLRDSSFVDMTVTSDPGSYAADRLMVIMKQMAPLPVTFTTISAALKNADILVEWEVSNEKNIIEYQVEKSTDGNRFSKVGTVASMNRQKYNWLDNSPAQGYNYYRIRSVDANGQEALTQIAKAMATTSAGDISVYPNPIKNNTINLQFSNEAAGNYELRLLNAAGQEIEIRQIKHPGGSAVEKLIFKNLAKGIYQIEISKPNGGKKVITVLK